jgi:hypothetical protein
MTKPDQDFSEQEYARHVGLALSYETLRTRSPALVVLERVAVLALTGLIIAKFGLTLAGWIA